MRSRLLLLVVLICLPLLLPACAPFPQESDWRWQQMNPNYHPPYPPDQSGRW